MTVTVRDTLGRGVKGACGQLGYEKVYEHREEIKETGTVPAALSVVARQVRMFAL